MREIIRRFVASEVKNMELKDNLTRYMVKKKKRGTYQAMEECGIIEDEIMKETVEYISQWLVNELIDGKLKGILIEEIKIQVLMELSRRGLNGIINI